MKSKILKFLYVPTEYFSVFRISWHFVVDSATYLKDIQNTENNITK